MDIFFVSGEWIIEFYSDTFSYASNVRICYNLCVQIHRAHILQLINVFIPFWDESVYGKTRNRALTFLYELVFKINKHNNNSDIHVTISEVNGSELQYYFVTFVM